MSLKSENNLQDPMRRLSGRTELASRQTSNRVNALSRVSGKLFQLPGKSRFHCRPENLIIKFQLKQNCSDSDVRRGIS